MNPVLLHKKVQEFIESNQDRDTASIVLSGSPFEGVNSGELAIQIRGKQKARKKLPTWFKTRGILYPPTVNLEQTSSEITAAYKSSLVQGDSLVDLTGGFGVDSFFFAQKIKKVIHYEKDPELSTLAAQNLNLLGTRNIEFRVGDSIDHLKESHHQYDWLFIDPSRRNDQGGRVFQLSQCLPNVPAHRDLLLEKSRRILIKTSPLLDLRAGIEELESVSNIHIVAVNNEVKEILWIMDRKQVPITVTSINFGKKTKEVFESGLDVDVVPELGAPETYLYEPNAAIMKSGLFNTLGKAFSVAKLHPNSQLFTSDRMIQFPGRRFEIETVLPFHKKKLKNSLGLERANITTRNFPQSVAQIRQQLKIKDGGNKYLFFTTLENGKKVVLICHKV